MVPYCLDVYTEVNLIVFGLPHGIVPLLYHPKNAFEKQSLMN